MSLCYGAIFIFHVLARNKKNTTSLCGTGDILTTLLHICPKQLPNQITEMGHDSLGSGIMKSETNKRVY